LRAEYLGVLFSYVSPEARVPKDHRLRVVAQLTNTALQMLSLWFNVIYASTGRVDSAGAYAHGPV
jgi:hypothetical protein